MRNNGSSATTTTAPASDSPGIAADPAFDLSARRKLRLGRTSGERREAADGHRVHGRLRIERDRGRLLSALEAAERTQTRAHAVRLEAEGRGVPGRRVVQRLFVYLASAVTIGITVSIYHEGQGLLRWLVGGALLGLAMAFTLDQLFLRRLVNSEPSGQATRKTTTRLVSVLLAAIAGIAGLHSALTATTSPIIAATAWIPPSAFALLLSVLLVRNVEHEGEEERALLATRRAADEADREVARLLGHLDRFRTTDAHEVLGDADALAGALDAPDPEVSERPLTRPGHPTRRPGKAGAARKEVDR